MRKIFTEGLDFSEIDSMIEELVGLMDKKELNTKEEEKRDNLQLEVAKSFGLENGLWIANITYKKYNKFLTTTRNMLVKDYDCKTAIELMLVDRIVGNYWRSMRIDTTLNYLIEKEDGGYTFNDSKMNIIRELNKGLESANRQLNANILLLKEIKQPSLSVKVNNAIIGQNQQFNVNKEKEQ